jgi:O-antigen/teichoic acid export membrane protein
LKALSVTFLASLLIQLVNVATGVLAARLLGPDGRGDLAAVMLWPMLLAGFGTLGIAEATTYAAASRLLPPRRIFAAGTAMAFVLALPLILVGWLLLPSLLHHQHPAVLEIGRLFLAIILLNYLTVFPTALFQGVLRLRAWNLVRTAVHFAYAAGCVLLWILDAATVANFATAMLLAVAIDLGLVLVLVAQEGWLGALPDRAAVATLLRYGAKVHLGYIGRHTNQWLDQALIVLLLTSTDLGLYVVALTLARGVTMVSGTLDMVAFPKIAAEPTPEGKLEVFSRYMKITLAAVVPSALALAGLTPWVLQLFFGDEFLPAAHVAYVLIAAYVVLTGTVMFSAALKAHDRTLIIGKVELVGLMASLALMSVLIPNYGIVGAAWSVLAANLVGLFLIATWSRSLLGLSLRQLVLPTAEDLRWVRRQLPGRSANQASA